MIAQIMELLRPEVFLEISNVNSLDVIEEDNRDEEGLRKVKILGIPKNSVAFSLDQKPSKKLISKFGKDGCRKLSWLIDDEHPKANKKCDFVIVSPFNGGCKIVLGELKSSYLREKDFRIQLENSKLYVTYLLTMLKKYHSINTNPVFKLVVLSKRGVSGKFQRKSIADYSPRADSIVKEPDMAIRKVERGRINYDDIS